jgi:superfamily II DNA/RNA helicase
MTVALIFYILIILILFISHGFYLFLMVFIDFLQLDRLVDIIVASPGRLLKHKYQSNVFLSHVNHIIIDEVDTMLTEGFGSDIRAILRSVISRPSASSKSSSSSSSATMNRSNNDGDEKEDDAHNLDDGDNEINSSSSSTNRVRTAKQSLKLQHHQQQLQQQQLQSINHSQQLISTPPVQVIMATATLTKAVRTLIDDVQNGGFNIEFNDPDNLTPRKSRSEDPRVKINIVEVDGVHR